MKFLKVFGFILLVLSIYVWYTMSSTGYFRTIENRFEGKILKKIQLPGAEDIQINDEQQFAIVSSTARQDLRSGKASQGGLYYLDLQSPAFEIRPLTADLGFPFYPHGISMIKTDSTQYRILAINHVDHQHSIEVFQWDGMDLTHQQTIKDPSLISPNDIVAIDASRYYFTNDHNSTSGIGKIAEDYLGLAHTNVIYFDGQQFREVANGIAYANGINYDQQRELLYVASPRGFLIKVYQRETDGRLTFIEDIDCQTGVDNIELDTEGRLWVGCHPSLLDFSAYAAGRKDKAPSEIITIDYRAKGDYQLESIFLDDGTAMSAATVAAPFQHYALVGNVMDQHFLILETAK